MLEYIQVEVTIKMWNLKCLSCFEYWHLGTSSWNNKREYPLVENKKRGEILGKIS